MKRKLNIITSAISVFLLIVALIPMTMAWFASNKEVKAMGMQVQVQSNANLIISDSSLEITQASYLGSTIEFSENEGKYAPCTHDSSDSYDTGLKYVSNADQVDFISGLKRGEVDLEYETASNGSNSTNYYYENTIYIASNGMNIPSAVLKASIASAQTGEVEIESGCLMATSVDFYLMNDSSELVYCGTSNVANKENVVIVDGEIPLNTEGYLTIVMRFYFDGGLLKESGNKAYINTATVDVRSANLNLSFTAEEK